MGFLPLVFLVAFFSGRRSAAGLLLRNVWILIEGSYLWSFSEELLLPRRSCSRDLLEGLVRGTDRGASSSSVILIEGLFVGVLLRLLPLRPLRFTNSSSAATVGEQRPKTLYAIFWDDLGFLIRRPNFFFYYVSQQRYHE